MLSLFHAGLHGGSPGLSLKPYIKLALPVVSTEIRRVAWYLLNYRVCWQNGICGSFSVHLLFVACSHRSGDEHHCFRQGDCIANVSS